jgi:hypothetical protein
MSAQHTHKRWGKSYHSEVGVFGAQRRDERNGLAQNGVLLCFAFLAQMQQVAEAVKLVVELRAALLLAVVFAQFAVHFQTAAAPSPSPTAGARAVCRAVRRAVRMAPARRHRTNAHTHAHTESGTIDKWTEQMDGWIERAATQGQRKGKGKDKGEAVVWWCGGVVWCGLPVVIIVLVG